MDTQYLRGFARFCEVLRGFARFCEVLRGFARTRRAADQVICHGHIAINDLKVNISRYRYSVGNLIGAYAHNFSTKYVMQSLEDCRCRLVPVRMTLDSVAIKEKFGES
jgi:small subunit ribosomal protein S4